MWGVFNRIMVESGRFIYLNGLIVCNIAKRIGVVLTLKIRGRQYNATLIFQFFPIVIANPSKNRVGF